MARVWIMNLAFFAAAVLYVAAAAARSVKRQQS